MTPSTKDARIQAAFERGFQARESGQDTLWNPYEFLYYRKEHDAWRSGWLLHQAYQIQAERKGFRYAD